MRFFIVFNGYIYDPLGRLWEINQGGSATTTRFLYDGDALIAGVADARQRRPTIDASGAITRRTLRLVMRAAHSRLNRSTAQ